MAICLTHLKKTWYIIESRRQNRLGDYYVWLCKCCIVAKSGKNYKKTYLKTSYCMIFFLSDEWTRNCKHYWGWILAEDWCFQINKRQGKAYYYQNATEGNSRDNVFMHNFPKAKVTWYIVKPSNSSVHKRQLCVWKDLHSFKPMLWVQKILFFQKSSDLMTWLTSHHGDTFISKGR